MGKGGLFFDWLLNELKIKREVRLFSNVYFSPTPINFLCEIMEALILNIDKIQDKIIHLVGDHRLSRYEFGKILASNLGEEYNTLTLPEEVDFKNSFFMKDLSLRQHDFVKKNQKKDFNSYIKEIIQEYASVQII